MTAPSGAQEPGAPTALPEAAFAERVHSVLETHCARCHEASAGVKAGQAGGFVNALALDEIADDPRLVVPGVPDASMLYVTMLNRHRPADIFRNGSRWDGPDTAEIALVRSWIGALDRSPTGPAHTTSALSLRTLAARYRAGDALEFSVQSTQDCHLTIIGVDPAGQAIVLFPSDLEPDNKLMAGALRRIPAESAGYLLKAGTKGRETIVAICSPSPRPPLRIVQDYEHERFTILGDWNDYLSRMLDEEAAGKAPKPKVERRRYRRRGAEPEAAAHSAGAGREVRATLVIEVE